MTEEKYTEVSSKPAWITLALLIVGAVNTGLIMFGYSPLPVAEAQIETFLVLGYDIVVAGYAWYKNMPTSKEGRIGTAVTRQLKQERTEDTQ